MNIFIAASSRNLERAIRVRTALIRLGFLVPCDWMGRMADRRDRGLVDADMTDDENMDARTYDLAGVDAADAVLWLDEGSRGATFESGYATNAGKLVVAVGTEMLSLYSRTAPIRFAKDSEAIEYLVMVARERAIK